jgi:hypothetical protein
MGASPLGYGTENSVSKIFDDRSSDVCAAEAPLYNRCAEAVDCPLAKADNVDRVPVRGKLLDECFAMGIEPARLICLCSSIVDFGCW